VPTFDIIIRFISVWCVPVCSWWQPRTWLDPSRLDRSAAYENHQVGVGSLRMKRWPLARLIGKGQRLRLLPVYLCPISTGLIDGRCVNGIKATTIFLQGHHVIVWVSLFMTDFLASTLDLLFFMWVSVSTYCSCRSAALSCDLSWIFAHGFTACWFI